MLHSLALWEIIWIDKIVFTSKAKQMFLVLQMVVDNEAEENELKDGSI